MDPMEYSDFCGAGDAGVDAAGCRRRRPTVRPFVRARRCRRQTPEGLSPPSLARSPKPQISPSFSPSQIRGNMGRERGRGQCRGNQEIAVNAIAFSCGYES